MNYDLELTTLVRNIIIEITGVVTNDLHVLRLLNAIDSHRAASAKGDEELVLQLISDNDLYSCNTEREIIKVVISKLRRYGWGPQLSGNPGEVLVNSAELAELRSIKNCVDGIGADAVKEAKTVTIPKAEHERLKAAEDFYKAIKLREASMANPKRKPDELTVVQTMIEKAEASYWKHRTSTPAEPKETP
jgi:hypothetical protein